MSSTSIYCYNHFFGSHYGITPLSLILHALQTHILTLKCILTHAYIIIWIVTFTSSAFIRNVSVILIFQRFVFRFIRSLDFRWRFSKHIVRECVRFLIWEKSPHNRISVNNVISVECDGIGSTTEHFIIDVLLTVCCPMVIKNRISMEFMIYVRHTWYAHKKYPLSYCLFAFFLLLLLLPPPFLFVVLHVCVCMCVCERNIFMLNWFPAESSFSQRFRLLIFERFI